MRIAERHAAAEAADQMRLGATTVAKGVDIL